MPSLYDSSSVDALVGGLHEPLDVTALCANERRGGPVRPVQIEERHASSIEQCRRLIKRLATTMRAADRLLGDGIFA